MKLDYFQQLFRKVALGEGSVISLFRTDGTLIVRNVVNDDKIGADWSHASVFGQIGGRIHGTFMTNRSVDGVPRLYAFHRVGDLPLLVVVGLSTDQVLSPWWRKVVVLSATFIVMAGSVLLLVWLLDGELRRRAEAERAAAELARTDGLTKLANRRSFEEALEAEWGRAAREARPLSLLMIDADHFKRFNDTYGHQAGDRVLMSLAEVIAKSTRRPADLAARYGGEEFAVLLPNTDAQGAHRIAAFIRDDLHDLGIEHDTSGHKIVTVSIGIATATPRSGISASSLVRDADAALYRAKGQGRDTVCANNLVRAALVRSSANG
jgi:diguanylate cyclase (GGDEF)-like protein